MHCFAGVPPQSATNMAVVLFKNYSVLNTSSVLDSPFCVLVRELVDPLN